MLIETLSSEVQRLRSHIESLDADMVVKQGHIADLLRRVESLRVVERDLRDQLARQEAVMDAAIAEGVRVRVSDDESWFDPDELASVSCTLEMIFAAGLALSRACSVLLLPSIVQRMCAVQYKFGRMRELVSARLPGSSVNEAMSEMAAELGSLSTMIQGAAYNPPSDPLLSHRNLREAAALFTAMGPSNLDRTPIHRLAARNGNAAWGELSSCRCRRFVGL